MIFVTRTARLAPPLPMRSARTRRAVLGALALTSLALGAACSDEQRRSLGEEDARASLDDRTGAAVDAAGDSLDGDLDCTASIDAAGVVAASCTGTTAAGDAVTGDYAGTADVDAETCAVQLVVTIAGQIVIDDTAVDCFAQA